MKKAILIISLVLLCCFTFSCQQREEVAEVTIGVAEADMEAIRNWVNSSYSAADSGDFEDYMRFWSEGLIWMPPNGPVIVGINSAAEMIKTYFEQVAIQHEISIEEVKVSGDFAYTRFNSEETYTPRTGEGESVEASFKVIILLQRMPEGNWLGTHLIWNSNGPISDADDLMI